MEMTSSTVASDTGVKCDRLSSGDGIEMMGSGDEQLLISSLIRLRYDNRTPRIHSLVDVDYHEAVEHQYAHCRASSLY